MRKIIENLKNAIKKIFEIIINFINIMLKINKNNLRI